ncbi:MAG TPA: phosphate signaling complex protein PhoU [Acidimicrobiia bacterium]|nr:phosphate signaling complex protein PhoU [Acidimicrobiia bacterium]
MTETGDARKSFHEALDELRNDVVRLAAMVTEQIGAATHALLAADLSAVEQVIANDKPIDELVENVGDRLYVLMARQQPMAGDLRTLITLLRLLPELERSGDLMKNVAKAARRLYPLELEPKVRGIIDQMGLQATRQMRVAIDAFADADVAEAAALADMDDAMDDLTKSLFRTILSSLTPDEGELQKAVQLSLIGRFYERVADHAVNIADRVSFMVDGVVPGSEDFEISL